MPLLVQKYGGTSVGDIARIQNIAQKIASAYQQGNQLVVVVSAMAGTTDKLLQMAQEVSARPDRRDLDLLLASGEQVSAALLSMALKACGCLARPRLAHQIRIRTNSMANKARITEIETEQLRADLAAKKVVVIAGFQGVDDDGYITTLGRGGSDTTAVALAATLQADECQIFTDVKGVYTSDPRIVPNARLLRAITFEEMLELASAGSKVLHSRSVEFAGKFNVPLRVLSSFHDDPGTLISYEEKLMESALISGIAFTRNESQLTIRGIRDEPGVASRLLGPIADAGIDVDMIVQNTSQDDSTDFTFTVSRDEHLHALEILQPIVAELGGDGLHSDCAIVKISLVGVGMRSHAGIASRMFKTLAKEGINILMIATSEIKISVILHEKYLELAVRSLHSAFGLEKEAQETR